MEGSIISVLHGQCLRDSQLNEDRLSASYDLFYVFSIFIEL